MRTENGRKKNKKLQIFLLLYLVLVSFSVVGGLIARYMTHDQAQEVGTVAAFEIEKVGDIFTQTFVVELSPTDGVIDAGSAFRLVNKSETAVSCTYSITYTENLPLSFQWTHDGVVADEIVLEAGETSNELQLQVKLTQQDDSYLFHREIDHVTLHITCAQVD